MAASELHLLFISTQRSLIEGFFRLWSAEAVLVVASTLDDGLRKVSEDTFDLILCDTTVDADIASEVLEYIGALNRLTPVVMVAHSDALEHVVTAFKAGAADYVMAEVLNTRSTYQRLLDVIKRQHTERVRLHEREQYHQANYDALREALSKANHDINNPLAIVSGNAQLLLEIGRMMSLDPDLMRPIEDIEEASQRLADLLRNVARIRDAVPHAAMTLIP